VDDGVELRALEVHPVRENPYHSRVLQLGALLDRARRVCALEIRATKIRHGHGFGQWVMGSVAVGWGAHSNNLMDNHTSPISDANCYNECKVRIRTAGKAM